MIYLLGFVCFLPHFSLVVVVDKKDKVPDSLSEFTCPEGNLLTLEHSLFFDSWVTAYWKYGLCWNENCFVFFMIIVGFVSLFSHKCRVEKDFVFHRYPSSTSSNSLEQIHLDKVLSVHVLDNENDFTFQISTSVRSWIFKCNDENELQDWYVNFSMMEFVCYLFLGSLHWRPFRMD